jgi:hypothetical protein
MAGIETKASSTLNKNSKSSHEMKALAVDYDKPNEQLLLDIAQYLASTMPSTEILLDVNSVPSERRDNLPS